VCIYVTDTVINATGFRGMEAGALGSSRLGFEPLWTAPNAGDTLVHAVWAYTAP
jgi:hypothetical protein